MQFIFMTMFLLSILAFIIVLIVGAGQVFIALFNLLFAIFVLLNNPLTWTLLAIPVIIFLIKLVAETFISIFYWLTQGK